MQLGQALERTAGWKAWLGAHLDCITPIRFSVGGIDKRITEYEGFISDQLTVFSRRAFVIVYKG